MYVILIVLLIIICLIIAFFTNTYNKFQNLQIKINEVEANIDTVLRKRFDLLNKSISIIKANIKTEQDVLGLIVKLRSRKLSNFELDRQIYEAINEFNYYKEHYEELNNSESIQKIDFSLNETEHEIIALRKYYNDTITKYNKLIKSIPSILVAKIMKYKEKTYFDGKDMTDDITNDFKL